MAETSVDKDVEKGELRQDTSEAQRDPADDTTIAINEKPDALPSASDTDTAAPAIVPPSPNHPGIDADGRVWWDSDTDPENPFFWPSWRRYSNCVLISVLTFVTPLASSVFAPAIPSMMMDFGSASAELGAFVVSIYVLGFAVGPMIMAPMSEIYGRVPIYHISNICCIAFTVGCALAPNLESLIVFRFLSGCFGSTPLTNGGGSIADMFTQQERTGVMAAFSVGPLIGPIIGPVIGGVLADNAGWRWVFWLVAIVSGVVAAAMVLIMKETFAPIILERKTRRLRKETGNPNLKSKLDNGLSSSDLLKRSIIRPTKLLVFSPICTVFAVYLMVVYGYLYLLFTSIPFVFQRTYQFSTSNTGLVYIGLGVGSLIGIAAFSADNTIELKRRQALAAETVEAAGSTNIAQPEVRLRLLPYGAIIFPIGFFIYGWTTYYHTHFMGPIVSLMIIGIGNLICFMAISVYLVDAYERYAASALAANTVMRSIAGATLPLCSTKMYDALGLGWGNSLLGFIAVALIPVPFIIRRYGEKLRKGFNMDSL